MLPKLAFRFWPNEKFTGTNCRRAKSDLPFKSEFAGRGRLRRAQHRLLRFEDAPRAVRTKTVH